MTEKDEKFFEKKMDRREFLKKAGDWRGWFSARTLWCFCFFRT